MHRSLFALTLAPALAFAGLASPISAQDEAGDTVNMVILYGDDAAPQPVGDEIVVVARLPENDRYRIPESLRFSDNPSNTAWAQRVERLEMIGNFGTLSCSTRGAGGFTGCTQEMIAAAYADRNSGSSVRFGRLIEAARAERLAQIDELAAEEQARVEEIENEYLRRLEAERSGPLPGDAVIDEDAPPPIDGAERMPPVDPSKDTPFDDGDETAQPLGAQVPARNPR